MREVDKNDGHRAQWMSAVDAKTQGSGKPYGRAEFDALLDGYRGIADVPGCIFVRELLAAYPDAKVILTIRPEDAWYESILSTLWQKRGDPDYQPNSEPTLADRWHEYFWQNDFPRNGREAYRRHNELVRSLTSPDKLLQYSVSEGWGPLCEFLGRETPAADTFPRSDDWATKGWKKESDLK